MKPRTERLAVLAKIRRTVGDRSDQGKVKKTLVFCIEDGERLPDAKFWQVRYTHRDHTHDRAFLHEEEIRDECRRGADYHFWHLYLCQCTGEPRMSDEGDVIGWFTRDEITGELPLTRPTGYFLGQLFGETGRNVRGR